MRGDPTVWVTFPLPHEKATSRRIPGHVDQDRGTADEVRQLRVPRRLQVPAGRVHDPSAVGVRSHPRGQADSSEEEQRVRGERGKRGTHPLPRYNRSYIE